MRARAGRSWSRSLVFNLSFAGEHHRNVIADGIDPVALRALQPVAIMDDFESCLAERTDKNLQQFRIHRHWGMVAHGDGKI